MDDNTAGVICFVAVFAFLAFSQWLDKKPTAIASESESANRGSSAGAYLSVCILVMVFFLKLTGHVDWPWWILLLPIWAPVALLAIVLVGLGLFFLALLAFEKFSQWQMAKWTSR